MKKTTFLALIIFSSLFVGCKSFELGGQNLHTMPLEPRSYDILGTIRAEAPSTKKEVTYDGLLQAARAKYGPDVDIINVKMDKMSKLLKKTDYLILNAYVIKYK